MIKLYPDSNTLPWTSVHLMVMWPQIILRCTRTPQCYVMLNISISRMGRVYTFLQNFSICVFRRNKTFVNVTAAVALFLPLSLPFQFLTHIVLEPFPQYKCLVLCRCGRLKTVERWRQALVSDGWTHTVFATEYGT